MLGGKREEEKNYGRIDKEVEPNDWVPGEEDEDEKKIGKETVQGKPTFDEYGEWPQRQKRRSGDQVHRPDDP